ncbi:MAG: NADH:flavin oxidoreductase [bacterium]|nr:NADH:flavin oxidoreductase [Deltaproteobacteria bacterium]MCP4908834.1 NADH:flavin oxidoreductase [bacterium]
MSHRPSPFDPLRIGTLEIPGRIFKTATSETRADPDGFVTDPLILFYEQMARGGTPMMITGNLYAGALGKSTRNMTGIDADEKIPGLQKLTDRVHALGSLIFCQISHCGRQVVSNVMGFEPVSASAVREPTMGTMPREISLPEIAVVIEEFRAAAARAAEAGFDGIQLHGGHGYLISQFLTPHTNRRGDEYGGSFENRTRLLVEILDAVRQATGPAFPILLKLNGADALPGRKGLATEELVRIGRLAQERSVDAIEVSVGHYESGFRMCAGSFSGFYREFLKFGSGRDMSRPRRATLGLLHPLLDRLSGWMWPPHEGFNLDYARRFKAALDIPVISVGGFQTKKPIQAALDSGFVDAVSCGRQFIADPFFYRHLLGNLPGPTCNFCNRCLARTGYESIDCFNPPIRSAKDEMLTSERVPGRAIGE